jgi:hypothetical protein
MRFVSTFPPDDLWYVLWLVSRIEVVVTMCEVTAACNKANANSNMVPYLNPDVMEVIFLHVTGKSLARCEQVCKLWKEVVQKLSQVKDPFHSVKYKTTRNKLECVLLTYIECYNGQ